MRKIAMWAASAVAVAAVGVVVAPVSRAATATSTDAVRALDALGGSGSAGIDPAEARAATEAAADAQTGDITFSVPSGTFQGQTSVGLSTGIANAQIRYTTDGTLPSASSTVYQGTPLVLRATTQLRAQAFVDGAASGAPGTAIYVARSIDPTHDLPLLVMDAYGGGKPARDYKDVAVMVMDRQSGNTASLGQAPSIATRAGFHVRGQSSANFEKTPYRLELWDNDNKDADYPMLGMPADADWALLGPFPDKTLIRDAFAYSLGRDMGLQAPRFAFIELYLNLDAQPVAADDYQGVYLLVETIKRSADRVNIQKLKKTQLSEPEISGGYIMQFNMMATEPPTLTCTATAGAPCWSDLELMEPDEVQPEQQAWITNYIQRFHNALHGTNPADPQTGYPAYIDVDSFINRIIHNEVAKEADSYIRSTHFYKDRGGKLVAGPLWDYDLGYAAFTGFGGFGGSTVDGWQYQPMAGMTSTTDWFVKLMGDATFVTQLKARWRTLRQGVLSEAQLTARLDAVSAGLANAAARNFQKWPNLNTATVGGFGTQTTQTWEQQLQIMRTFLTQRTAWIDQTANWGGGGSLPPVTTPPVTTPPVTTPPVTTPPVTTPPRTTPPVTTPPATSPSVPAGRTCTAAYTIISQWQGGFQGEVKVTAGSSTISGWTVSWTFGNGQTISQTWNATITTSGTSVTAKNVSYNGGLGAGGSTSFGFIGTWNGSNSVPAVACTAS